MARIACCSPAASGRVSWPSTDKCLAVLSLNTSSPLDWTSSPGPARSGPKGGAEVQASHAVRARQDPNDGLFPEPAAGLAPQVDRADTADSHRSLRRQGSTDGNTHGSRVWRNGARARRTARLGGAGLPARVRQRASRRGSCRVLLKARDRGRARPREACRALEFCGEIPPDLFSNSNKHTSTHQLTPS